MLTISLLEEVGYQPLVISQLTDEQANTAARTVVRTLKQLLGERTPVNYPEFSQRALNCLLRSKIATMGELSQWRWKIPGAGPKSLAEMQRELLRYQLPVPQWITQELEKAAAKG